MVQDQFSSHLPDHEMASWECSLSWGGGTEERLVRERGCE